MSFTLAVLTSTIRHVSLPVNSFSQGILSGGPENEALQVGLWQLNIYLIMATEHSTNEGESGINFLLAIALTLGSIIFVACTNN